jgi:putative NADH-flavin reductase
MQITVFGANGKVGRLVVKEALSRGHAVAAFVHGGPLLFTHSNLTVLQGDIYDQEAVYRALRGSQAVISCLGSWHTPKKDVLSSGMKNIIPAMQGLGIRRIISLTGADARDVYDEPDLIHRWIYLALRLIAPKILKDGEDHISLLRQSDMDWTVVRSPIMNNLGKDTYRFSVKLAPIRATINRSSVAKAMVDLVKTGQFIKAAPVILRKQIQS